MATINSRETVDKIIAANGALYYDEAPVIKIVQYNNQFNGALVYGLIFAGDDPLKYERAPACHNPVVIFERR